MIFNGHPYSSARIGADFTFAIMWHTSPSRALDVTKPEDVILAVNNAYRDMMPRTINGLGLSKLDALPAKTVSNSDKQSLRNVKAKILDDLRMNLAKNIIEKVFNAKGGIGEFNNAIHEALCDEFIRDFVAKANDLNVEIVKFNSDHALSPDKMISRVDIKKITYGKAQKIVNMTMKQLYCFDNAHTYQSSVFQYCHIPIDSVILEFFCLNSKYVWSNLDKTEYSKVQCECKRQWDDKVTEAKLRPSDDMRHIFFAEFVIWDAKNRLGETIETMTIF